MTSQSGSGHDWMTKGSTQQLCRSKLYDDDAIIYTYYYIKSYTAMS